MANSEIMVSNDQILQTSMKIMRHFSQVYIFNINAINCFINFILAVSAISEFFFIFKQKILDISAKFWYLKAYLVFPIIQSVLFRMKTSLLACIINKKHCIDFIQAGRWIFIQMVKIVFNTELNINIFLI
jgi:hypothetical protein